MEPAELLITSIRNKLYHDGTGLSVDEQYLLAYRQIAVLILKNLFGIDPGDPRPAPTLERLIVLWNQIEEARNALLKKEGIDRGHTFLSLGPRALFTAHAKLELRDRLSLWVALHLKRRLS